MSAVGESVSEDWRTTWPDTPSVRDWILASAEKARSIEDPEKRATQVAFAAGRLADRGFLDDARAALADVDAILAAHPEVVASAMARMAESYVAAGREDAARAYFAAAIERVAADASLKPKPRAQRVAMLRDTAVRSGFVELGENVDPKWVFLRDLQHVQALRRAGDLPAALAAAREMGRRMDEPRDRWALTALLRLYAEAGDRDGALRMFDLLPTDDRKVTLVGAALIQIGLRDRIRELARADIRRALDRARSMTLPNYHFPAMTIASTLTFLLDHGEADFARDALHATLDELEKWDTDASGWVAAAVYSQLALPVARIDGRASAEALLDRAAAAAKSDTTAFRGGAWGEIIKVYEQLGAWDEALAIAKKNGPMETRRRNTARVLALAGRWKDLAVTCAKVKSPTEASELAWWVAARLDGL
jgi:tetratricopeptide (TPR) repeat protein